MEAARIGGRRAAAVASTRKSEWSAAVSELIAVIKAVRAISPERSRLPHEPQRRSPSLGPRKAR